MNDVSQKLVMLEKYRFYAKIALLLILLLGFMDSLVELILLRPSSSDPSRIIIFLDLVTREYGATIKVESSPYRFLYLCSLFSIIISILLELKDINSKESRTFDWLSSTCAGILLIMFIRIIFDHKDGYRFDFNIPFFLLFIIILINLVRYAFEVIYHLKYLNSK